MSAQLLQAVLSLDRRPPAELAELVNGLYERHQWTAADVVELVSCAA